MDGAFLAELTAFLQWFDGQLGHGATALLVFGLPTLFWASQVISKMMKDREADRLVEAKNETIERMAEENRMLRAAVFGSNFGMTAEEIEDIVNSRRGRQGDPQAKPSRKKGKRS